MFAKVELRHPFGQGCERGLVGLDGDVVGALHQRDFGWRLDHAAAGRHGRGEHEPARGRGGPQALGDEEAHALLDPDRAGGNAAVPEDARDDGPPVLIFLPHPHIVAEPGDLAGPRLFEAGRDVREVALRGNDQQEGALARAPRDVHEVPQARTRLEDDGTEAVVAHEPPRLVDARLPLVIADRHRRTGKWPECGDRLRRDGQALTILCPEWRRRERRRRGNGCLDESPSREGHGVMQTCAVSDFGRRTDV